jgi:hypothetical protein
MIDNNTVDKARKTVKIQKPKIAETQIKWQNILQYLNSNLSPKESNTEKFCTSPTISSKPTPAIPLPVKSVLL